MGKYFGTDGVRGEVNHSLSVDQALRIGYALGQKYKGQKIVVGMDTRLSSSMLKNALSAGICATGGQVYDLGLCSTPVVAYLSSKEDFACGVMISASHNPYYDNGIKIFNHQGVKIDDEIEAEIEAVMDGEAIQLATRDHIGQVVDYHEGINHYIEFLKKTVNVDLSGLSIAIDCANGSASVTAQKVLEALGAKLWVSHSEPDGYNINTNCGSTHPKSLQNLVIEKGCDVGFAFDGDADRCIAVDETGELFDGDKTLFVCAKQLKDKKALNHDTLVTTVMANLGLHKALEAHSIKSIQTQVGDKYVYEQMLKHHYVLGGEQSGHIIFSDHLTTGDGLLTALKLLEVMVDQKQSLKDLSQELSIYPQVLKNVKVKDKKQAIQDESLKQAILKVEQKLEGNGRILVRPSGTEPLVRVMAEAQTIELCNALVDEISNKIEELGL